MKMKMSEWISVKERLPESDGKYLIYYYGGYDIAKFKNGKFYVLELDLFNSLEWRHEEAVTHWVPLPEPPIAE